MALTAIEKICSFRKYKRRISFIKREFLLHYPHFYAYFAISLTLFTIFAVLNVMDLISLLRWPIRNLHTKCDWHDWKLIDDDDHHRSGLGEHGESAYLPVYPDTAKQINNTHGFNGYLSDKIALNRSLKDLRPDEYVYSFAI